MENRPPAPAIPAFPEHAAGTRRPWVMAMSWRSLLFMHWPVDAEALRATLPEPVRPYLDTFDGRAWLGVVPFEMAGVRGRGVPPIPGLSRFPELNLRTYLRVHGKPGVWFYSLDAHSRVAVRVARKTFHLPYFDADMSCRRETDHVHYQSRRTHRGAHDAVFRARYQPTGPVQPSEPDTLEHFLTERYCLFSLRPDGPLLRGDIDHAPWPLQPAEAEVQACDMFKLIGREAPAEAPLLHYADRVDVRAWWPVPETGLR